MMLAAAAAAGGSLFGISLVDGKGGASVGVPMQITILMTLLALLPAAIMSVTPFLRISIVLHFLRQALGTQSTPSNQVLVGLSLFLSMLIVGPVFQQIHSTAWVPMEQGAITQDQAFGHPNQ
jgi:flagellar biosynthetic protein FliP